MERIKSKYSFLFLTAMTFVAVNQTPVSAETCKLDALSLPISLEKLQEVRRELISIDEKIEKESESIPPEISKSVEEWLDKFKPLIDDVCIKSKSSSIYSISSAVRVKEIDDQYTKFKNSLTSYNNFLKPINNSEITSKSSILVTKKTETKKKETKEDAKKKIKMAINELHTKIVTLSEVISHEDAFKQSAWIKWIAYLSLGLSALSILLLVAANRRISKNNKEKKPAEELIYFDLVKRMLDEKEILRK
jgi:hypothetical protein